MSLFDEDDGYMLNLGIIEIFRELKKTPCSPNPFNCFECPSGGTRLDKHLCWNILLIHSPDHLKKHQTGFLLKKKKKVLVIEVLFVVQTGVVSQIYLPVYRGAASRVFVPYSRWMASEVKEMNNVIWVRVVWAQLHPRCLFARVQLLLQTFL